MKRLMMAAALLMAAGTAWASSGSIMELLERDGIGINVEPGERAKRGLAWHDDSPRRQEYRQLTVIEAGAATARYPADRHIYALHQVMTPLGGGWWRMELHRFETDADGVVRKVEYASLRVRRDPETREIVERDFSGGQQETLPPEDPWVVGLWKRLQEEAHAGLWRR